MDKIQLKSVSREAKDSLAKLRKSGMMPAVLYGHHVPNTMLAVNQNEFEKVLRKAGESTIVDLETQDGKKHPVLIHDVQMHVLKATPIHVDFYEVDMTEKLTATVALEYTGESHAVKALGGTLVKVLSEVEVECLPSDLPHNLEVDISGMNSFSDVILVKDLKVPAKVTITTDAEETVAKVQPPRDVEAELATPVVEDVTAVEGAAEQKPATEGAEAEKKAE